MISIEESLYIAIQAHKGQKDLDGKPVILHPLAVGMMGSTRLEIVTGFLHDVVEDSHFDISDLKSMGVDDEVLVALTLLTHHKGQDYFDYIRNIISSNNQLAIVTKQHDLIHNYERGKKGNHVKQVEKHKKALALFGYKFV